MAKIVIDKELITGIAAQSNQDFYNSVEKKSLEYFVGCHRTIGQTGPIYKCQ